MYKKWHKVKDDLETHPQKDHIEDKIDETLDKYLHKIKAMDCDLYKDLMCDLYVNVHGEHFNKEMAMEAVSKMENEDGSTGAHWTLEQVEKIIPQYGLVSDYFNKYDVYYVMNMAWSDFYPLFGTGTESYAKYTKAFLNDKDVPEGKAYRYYTEVAMDD